MNMGRQTHPIIIYTDGSSIGNPGPGGWGAVIGYRLKVVGDSKEGRVIELGGRENRTTNNRMELIGAIRALEKASELLSAYKLQATSYRLSIFTDSSYLINGITKWVHGWKKNGWVTGKKEPVLNQELWEELHALAQDFNIEWKYAPGHAGVPGNERVDEIAQGLARGEKVKLYDGDYAKYKVDLTPQERPAGSGKVYSYVSLVDGKVMRHTTWTECERRVKGKAGAKFKKTFSAADETRTLKEWDASL